MSYLKIGHVYILESSDGCSIKIGRSRNPKSRLATLKTQSNAGGRSWISKIQGDCHSLEKMAHSIFEQKREYGEWFSVSYDEAVERISRLLTDSPSEEDIKLKRSIHTQECNKRIDNFNLNLNKIAPVQDKEWEKSLMLANIASELFSMSMINVDFFNKKEQFGGLSLFALSFAFVVYGKDDFFIACLFADCSDALNTDDAHSIIGFIDHTILKIAESISKELNNELS